MTTKYLYLVPGKDINVYNDDNSIKQVTNEVVLGSLDYTPITAKDDDGYVVFDNLAAAQQFALVDQKKHPKDAFAIMILTPKEDGFTLGAPVRINARGATARNGRYTAYEVNAKEVTIIGASLKHSSEKFDDFIYDKAAFDEYLKTLPAQPAAKEATPAPTTPPSSTDGTAANTATTTTTATSTTATAVTTTPTSTTTPTDPAATQTPPANTTPPADPNATAPAAQSSWLDIAKKWLPPTFIIGGTGAGFAASGAGANAAALLTKALGIAVPTVGVAGIATQVAIAGAVGLAAYGTFLAAKVVVGALWNAAKAAWTDFKKTQKQKYDDRIAATTKEVEALETELHYDANSPMHKALADLLTTAPEAQFDANGKLISAPAPAATDPNAATTGAAPAPAPAPILNRLQVLEKERQALKDIKAANDATKRQELEGKILTTGFKFS